MIDVAPLVTVETVLPFLAVGGILLGAYLIVWGINGFRRALTVWAHDPVPAEEAALVDGTLEVEGTAEPLAETLRSPYDDAQCLAYSYTKKRKEHDPSDDDGGTEWRTVDSGSDAVPFAVADDSGSVPVDPSAATLGLDTAYSDRGARIKRTESRLDPGDGVHVIGQKRPARETDADLGDARAYIGDGEEVPTFRITDGGELETVARMVGRSALSVVAGGVACGLAVHYLSTRFPELVPV